MLSWLCFQRTAVAEKDDEGDCMPAAADRSYKEQAAGSSHSGAELHRALGTHRCSKGVEGSAGACSSNQVQRALRASSSCPAEAEEEARAQTKAQPHLNQRFDQPHQTQPMLVHSQLEDRYSIPFSELVFHQVIGQGSFKSVYRGRWRNTNVAIVRMRKGGLVTEARLMQKLSTHPNLVQFYRWSRDTQGNEYIILELVPLGSLDKILLRFGEVLRTSVKLSIAEQIAAAMDELSAEGVLHRDLAARNVLVQSVEPVHVKVADFGLAHQSAYEPFSTESTTSGNATMQLSSIPVRWCAPEVLSHQSWGPASDVWAFGVTLWELFANGAEPYAALSDQEVAQVVMAGGRLPRPPRCPREVFSLMMDCWSGDSLNRPTFAGILATFSKWRQQHEQAQQLQLASATHARVGRQLPIVSSSLQRAQSWELQHAALTASNPVSHLRSSVSSSSSCPISVGSGPVSCHVPITTCIDGSMQLPTTTAGVCRSNSEPLPSWDLNQHVQAALQPAGLAACPSAAQTVVSSRAHATDAACMTGHAEGTARQLAIMGSKHCSCWTACMAGGRAVIDAAAPAEAMPVCRSSSSSIHSVCGTPQPQCRNDNGVSILHVNPSPTACHPAAVFAFSSQHHKLEEHLQHHVEQLSYVPLSKQASGDSCFSQLTSPWYIDSTVSEETSSDSRSGDACEAELSAELSFEVEQRIDPSDLDESGMHGEIEGICGSWAPCVGSGTVGSAHSSMSSTDGHRLAVLPARTSALYQTVKVQAGQVCDSTPKPQTAALPSSATGPAAMPGSAAPGVMRHNPYVDVRTVVYGNPRLAYTYQI